MTFSIAAWDDSCTPPEWGVAVASKFLAVGSAVPWVEAGAGAIATQALANLSYGPDGLTLLREGTSAENAVARLTGADEGREDRQLGIVDSQGRAATFTGSDCFDWAGGRTGDGFCCQGNILTGPDVVDAMVEAFTSTQGELAVRLLAALKAGDDAGGDSRGRQSAHLYIAREGGGYMGGVDRSVDLRVDDHADPVAELYRLFDLHRLYFPRPEDLRFEPLTGEVEAEVRVLLQRKGHDPGSDEVSLKEALLAYIGTENLEERWRDDGTIEQGILDHLRS